MQCKQRAGMWRISNFKICFQCSRQKPIYTNASEHGTLGNIGIFLILLLEQICLCYCYSSSDRTQTHSNNCIGTGWELGICKKGTFVLRRKKEQWSSPYYPEMHWNLFPHLSIIEQGHDLVFKELCLLFELKIWIRLTLKLVWNTLDQKHGMRNCKLSDFISWSTSFRCFSKYPWFLWRIEIGNIDGPKVIGNVWDCEKISRWVSTKSRTSTWFYSISTPTKHRHQLCNLTRLWPQ